MKRLILFSAFFALLLLAAAPQARAQTDISVGPRVGYYDAGPADGIFIGADARIGISTLPIRINPTFDYFFTEGDGTTIQVTGNALYEFGIDNVAFTPYAGGGLSVFRFSGSGFSNTDLGLNLLGGAEFTEINGFVPFAQAEFVLGGDTDPFKITAGILFNVGS